MNEPGSPREPVPDRTTEWFVPRFGSDKFRTLVGLLFLPYTGMVLAYTVIGGMLAPRVHWDRVGALLIIYLLGLGIGAHAFDALGGRSPKPWGKAFPDRQLWVLGVGSLLVAYVIGAYYMIRFTPWLWPVAIAEGFFVLAYNLEWGGGRFHTDGWFAVSWGALPVVAGYVLQTNALGAPALLVAAAAALLSLVEIKASRPYKALKRAGEAASPWTTTLEGILKCVSGGVILLGAGLAAMRWNE